MDYNSLREGQEVEFKVERGRDGRSKAVGVKLAATKSSQGEVVATALENVEDTPSEPQAEETTQED